MAEAKVAEEGEFHEESIRIASFLPSATEMLYALQLGDFVVGECPCLLLGRKKGWRVLLSYECFYKEPTLFQMNEVYNVDDDV